MEEWSNHKLNIAGIDLWLWKHNIQNLEKSVILTQSVWLLRISNKIFQKIFNEVCFMEWRSHYFNTIIYSLYFNENVDFQRYN